MSTAFQQEVAQNLGNVPFVYYGSYQIDVNDIYFFSLYYEGGIPYFKVSFYDTLNLMKDKAMPLDDAKIKVFLNPRSEQLKEILIQFKIISFIVSESRYNIIGIIDIDLLLVPQRKSYPNMSSHKVLQQIAKEAGVGFNTNINDTNDAMTWINTGNAVKDFMEEVTEASYKSDVSFLASFVDFYYNFNMIDLAKELDRNIDAQLGITDRSLSDVVKTINPEMVTNLLISNDESLRETNLFFESYRIINNSTGISLQSGYKNTIEYYDGNSKDLLVFVIDSITSKDSKSIILKGSPQDENFFNLNTNTHYLGKFDSDNCHKNYNYAWIQNEKNLFELEKMGLELHMRTPNFSIYRYQKIKIFLSNQSSTPSVNIQNQRLSGDWLVVDIRFIYSQGKFTQVFRLVKRELELSDEELANEAPINSTQLSSTTTNNNEVNNNYNNPIPPPGGNTSSTTNNSGATGEVSSILTKDIWRRIYNGKVNPKVIELMYNSVVSAMEKYGINTKVRIVAFISQINAESGFLKAVTEYSSGIQYDNRDDLGNGPDDGPKYKGRGLLQITGKTNYKKSGQFLNKDFINYPDTVAADNKTHIAAADSSEQLSNSALVSIRYWLKGSSWGNLNQYADDMNINKPIDTGIYSQSGIPNTQKEASNAGFKRKASNNFATDASSSNDNLLNFTLISFGINGGYNGYRDRINNWNDIRKYFV